MSALDILVVDDDRDHADSLAEIFSLEGHRVEVAYSGDAAIAAYGRRDFDIAFMDVMMPGRNGVESFLEIRRLRPEAKVYMMTGYSVEELLRQAVDEGALGVLAKPVIVDEVMSTIDKVKPHGIVLIAEDDPDLGPQIKESVATTGRRCELVTDGKAALERVARGGVDVLILDLKMPLINGIDVYTSLRSNDLAVPTIMITAVRNQMEDSLAALSDIETTGILNKPFDPADLLERLERLAR